MSVRLIVAGSRWYPAANAPIVYKVLRPYLEGVIANKNSHEYVLVHGACPPKLNGLGVPIAGLDHFASEYWIQEGGQCEPYPAEWGKCDENCTHKRSMTGYCSAAGPRRNQSMADRDAEECLGFPWFTNEAKSIGTIDMMRRAYVAGIPTYRVRTNGTKERYTGRKPPRVPSMWPIEYPHDPPARLL